VLGVKVMSSMKRLMMRQRDSGGRVSHYNIKQGLLMSGRVSKENPKTSRWEIPNLGFMLEDIAVGGVDIGR
jgi:hypothetical protein